MDISQFIDNVVAGNAAAAKENLNDLLSSKAFQSIDNYKKQLSQNIFGGNFSESNTTQNVIEESEESEHYKAGHEYAADHAMDSGFKVTARARKKEMLADNPHKKGTPEHADWHRGALDGHQTALHNM